MRGGDADLELCTSDGELALLVVGHPAVLVWQGGDHGEEAWILRARDVEEVLSRVGPLSVCEVGVDPRASLADQLAPLLSAMSDGGYTATVLSATELSRDASVAPERPAHTGSLMTWIGLHRVRSADDLLVGCMPREAVEPRDIDAARAQIQAGKRPAVLVLTTPVASASFVIAGHAALEAYALEGRVPTFVELAYHAPRTLAPEDLLRLTDEAARRCAQLVSAHLSAIRSARPVAS